ncbi:MAG: hypothetical protein C6Y22_27380 [Hapalosiphonaceae cyanobacterium JJU2]|nr:MAG: hypothetical protein C6Y22_27380 [Hapalosiphonaceae cyanobacterium JJU2]
MPNPKGTPENLKKFVTDREEPLTEQWTLRITKTMKQRLNQVDDAREFCRQAIQKALDELEQINQQDN